jgi:hypothetical protein
VLTGFTFPDEVFAFCRLKDMNFNLTAHPERKKIRIYVFIRIHVI